MPWTELLLHLTINGDDVASKRDGHLRTELGHKYVESVEGRELVHGSLGPAWRNKTIWCRV